MASVDEYSYINERSKQIVAERLQHILGKPIEAPADIDWTGWNMYSAPSEDSA